MRHFVALSLSVLVLATACKCGGSSPAGGGVTTPEGGGGGGETPSAANARHFFMPIKRGDNTTAPKLLLDGAGGLHSVYAANAVGGAYYTYCANGCASETDVGVVHFDTDSTVLNAMLALTPSGKPRVLLSTRSKVFYGTCDSGCTDVSAWTVTPVLDHGGKKEVSGHGFALDPQGHPRFILHTYVTYLGIGQGGPKTEYVTCDDNCGSADAWTANVVSTEYNWYRPELVFDKEGVPQLGATLDFVENGKYVSRATFFKCRGDCSRGPSWTGTTLEEIYWSEKDAIRVKPSLSLALTESGAPRMAILAPSAEGKAIIYMGCDALHCTETDLAWNKRVVQASNALGEGLDLALDAQGHPRIAYTHSYSIVLGTCDADNCDKAEAKWSPTIIEDANNMKSTEISLYANCNVSGWFLHGPSLVLTRDGTRVGYQSEDVSVGGPKDNPRGPDCVAGTELTWTRLAVVAR